MAIVKSSSWTKFYREVEAFFRNDHQVHVVFDKDGGVLCLYVEDAGKANALSALFPSSVTFGSLTIDISVVSTDTASKDINNKNIYEAAFEGNKAFCFVKKIDGIFPDGLTYVVFKREVVQYFNDDLCDIYGQCSTLYQEIAKDIFGETNGICFCTERLLTTDQFGEWP